MKSRTAGKLHFLEVTQGSIIGPLRLKETLHRTTESFSRAFVDVFFDGLTFTGERGMSPFFTAAIADAIQKGKFDSLTDQDLEVFRVYSNLDNLRDNYAAMLASGKIVLGEEEVAEDGTRFYWPETYLDLVTANLERASQTVSATVEAHENKAIEISTSPNRLQ